MPPLAMVPGWLQLRARKARDYRGRELEGRHDDVMMSDWWAFTVPVAVTMLLGKSLFSGG